MYHGNTIGVVIPAHNEAPAISAVVRELRALSAPGAIPGEPPSNQPQLVDHIIVCDNASTDGTATLARKAGAQVVAEPRKGYGAACLRAIAAMPPVDCVVFVDGDHSTCANELADLLAAWRAGADLVIGSRALGDRQGLAERGAQTPHQNAGNWLAGFLLSAIWRTKVTDLGPFRAIDRRVLEALRMRDQAFGWTVEMQARALAMGFTVREFPVSSLRRIGVSKVSGTWRGSLGASFGILGTIARIGGNDLKNRLWAQLKQSTTIESQTKDSLWKKPS